MLREIDSLCIEKEVRYRVSSGWSQIGSRYGRDGTNKREASSSNDPFPDGLMFWMPDREMKIDESRDRKTADGLANGTKRDDQQKHTSNDKPVLSQGRKKKTYNLVRLLDLVLFPTTTAKDRPIHTP
jgi:hypothetical protein